MKYLLKSSAIDFISVMLFLSARISLGKFFCLYFPFPTASLMTFHYFLLLFLYFSINLEKDIFFDHFKNLFVILIFFFSFFISFFKIFQMHTLLPFRRSFYSFCYIKGSLIFIFYFYFFQRKKVP